MATAKAIKLKRDLVGIQPLVDILELTLQTAFLKPYEPVSLMILANPESAKTQALFKHSSNDFVYYTNDITAKMLIDNVLVKAVDKKIRYLMIPDLLNCIEKQKSSRDSFLNLIKSVIEEGVHRIDSFYKRIECKEAVKIGMISALTTNRFNQNQLKRYMKDTGILSRFIPFSYCYPLDKIAQIFNSIQGFSTKSDPMLYRKIQTKDEDILITPNFAKQLEIIARELSKENGGAGFRAQIQLDNLARANAKINLRSEVIQEDIDKIMSLSKWLNFNFNQI